MTEKKNLCKLSLDRDEKKGKINIAPNIPNQHDTVTVDTSNIKRGAEKFAFQIYPWKRVLYIG